MSSTSWIGRLSRFLAGVPLFYFLRLMQSLYSWRSFLDSSPLRDHFMRRVNSAKSSLASQNATLTLKKAFMKFDKRKKKFENGAAWTVMLELRSSCHGYDWKESFFQMKVFCYAQRPSLCTIDLTLKNWLDVLKMCCSLWMTSIQTRVKYCKKWSFRKSWKLKQGEKAIKPIVIKEILQHYR